VTQEIPKVTKIYETSRPNDRLADHATRACNRRNAAMTAIEHEHEVLPRGRGVSVERDREREREGEGESEGER